VNGLAIPDAGWAATQWMLYVALAPLVTGTLSWFEARLQGRRGAAPTQPYRDLWKLLATRPSVPQDATAIFRLAPSTVFTCALLLGAALPRLGPPGMAPMDPLLAVGVIGLARFALTLAAFDSGSPVAVMSSGRQWFLHILVEPTLVIAIYFSATRSILGAQPEGAEAAGAPVVALVIGSVGLVLLAETGRLPFDMHGGHLELTMIEEGPGLDYGGRALALVRWAEAMRLTFAMSLVALLATRGLTAHGGTHPLAALALYLVTMVVLLLGLAVLELRWVKVRPRSALTLLTSAAGIVVFGLVALVVASTTARR
jgi:formate hydrogenlyase subunit 4